MGTIKFELDIPEFENTLDINISLTRDRNWSVHYSVPTPVPVVCDTSTTTATVFNNEPVAEEKQQSPVLKDEETAEEGEVKKKVTKNKKRTSGNLMNSDLF